MNEATNTTTRRDIMGASAVLLLAAPAAGASERPEQDAELIAICEAYCQREMAYARLCWSDDDPNDEHPGEDRAAAQAQFAEAQIGQISRANAIITADPTTLAGLRAKARAVVAFWGGKYSPSGAGDAIMWSMVCDLTDDGSLSAGRAGA